MLNINLWFDNFINNLNQTFGDRVWFVGLQGSYARGEANESSDIDTVVILDKLTTDDIKIYNDMLELLPYRELICGFLSGKDELLNWETSDLFQFYYDTKPIKGSLDEIVDLIDANAIDRAIKTGVCNIYHGCIHNMLYDNSKDILYGLYKAASFVIQAICFKQTGRYVCCQKDMIRLLSADEQRIIEIFQHLKEGNKIEFDPMSETLLVWSQKIINTK